MRSLTGEYWTVAKDADVEARSIFWRHYSRRVYRDGRRPKQFVGPGEHIVLVGCDGAALFVWRKFISLDLRFGDGINCAVFRNEGAERSSDLIREAELVAWFKWPGQRLYTYVNAKRVRSSNPGYCFLCAGWSRVGRTKGGLIVLEKWPVIAEAMR